jgi:hypothetical protein
MTSFDSVSAATSIAIAAPKPTMYRLRIDPATELAKFLARPVFLGSTTWPTSTTIASPYVLDVWNTLLNRTTIRQKMTYYSGLRATMNVRLESSTTAHHYGLVSVHMVPKSNINYTMNGWRLSSLPISYLWDANDPSPVDLAAPFSYPNDYFPLNAILSDYPPYVFNMCCLQPLMRDDGVSPGSININIYAYLTDIELFDPTPLNVLSGRTKRRPLSESTVTSGAISGPLTTVAASLSLLGSLPVIGDYARATALASGKLASVAKLLGYSKPPVSQDVTFMKQRRMGNICTTDGTDTLVKLSGDPAQELPISAGSSGTEPDPLAFSVLLRRWGFLNSFLWATANPLDYVLAVIPVTPWINCSTGASNFYFMPMSLPAVSYSFWSGDIEYEIVVSATSFHRGKLLIWYSPAASSLTATTTSAILNTGQCCVFDVATSTTKRMTVGWSSQEAMLPTGRTDNFQFAVPIQGISAANTPDTTCNGALVVQVLEPLQATASGATLTLSVYARGGTGLNYAVPYDEALTALTVLSGNTSRAAPISRGADNLDSDFCHFGGAPLDPQTVQCHIGEAVASLRPIMKRYCASYVYFPSALSGGIGFSSSLFPLYAIARGSGTQKQPWGTDTTGSIANTGSCTVRNTTFTIMSQCFQGVRGGFRWKVVQVASTNSYTSITPAIISNAWLVSVSNCLQSPFDGWPRVLVPSTIDGTNILGLFPGGTAGSDVDYVTDGIITAIEVPYAMPTFNYVPVRRSDITPSFAPYGFNLGVGLNWVTSNPEMVFFSAIAEDTNFHIWSGVPTLTVTNGFNGIYTWKNSA